MKKLFQKYGGFLATLAIVVTTMNANATCLCIFGDYNFQRTNIIIKQSGRHILYDLPTVFL